MNSATSDFLELARIVDEIRSARNPKPKKAPPKKTKRQIQLEADIRTAQRILDQRKKDRGEVQRTDPNAPDLNVFIDGRLPQVDPTTAIVESVFQGKGWKDATLTAAERAAEEKRLEEERSGLVEIPAEVWE